MLSVEWCSVEIIRTNRIVLVLVLVLVLEIREKTEDEDEDENEDEICSSFWAWFLQSTLNVEC